MPTTDLILAPQTLPTTRTPLYTTGALKRQFSEAYLRMMAAVQNVQCTVYPSGDDIDSVDVEFDSGRFGLKSAFNGMNRKLEVQLKCTTPSSLASMADPVGDAPSLRYYLARSDYDRLAISQDLRPYPHVLVVLEVPPDPADWMLRRGSLTLLRARAWWLDLTDAPAATHPVRQPVFIPRTQAFDLTALDYLMREPQ